MDGETDIQTDGRRDRFAISISRVSMMTRDTKYVTATIAVVVACSVVAIPSRHVHVIVRLTKILAFAADTIPMGLFFSDFLSVTFLCGSFYVRCDCLVPSRADSLSV